MKDKNMILIVDDDPTNREVMKALLSQKGYSLAFVSSGPDALSFLRAHQPSTILLDVVMPGMDGFEVCRRIKADDRGRYIPIILVTALDRKEDMIRGLDVGADDFIVKPVNGPELRSRVRTMLRIKAQYDHLVQTLRLRESLSDMIAHDMRKPLASILALCESLRETCAETDSSQSDAFLRL